MKTTTYRKLWPLAVVALGLGALGVSFAAEHPTGGAEHPSSSSGQSAAPAPAASAAKTAPAAGKTSMEGEVLDLSCYLGHGAMGKGHAKCARKCLAGGASAGLMTADGAALLLIEDHDEAKAFKALRGLGGEKAKVTGTMAEKGGLKALIVSDVQKL